MPSARLSGSFALPERWFAPQQRVVMQRC